MNRLRLHVNQIRLPSVPGSRGDDRLDNEILSSSGLLQATMEARLKESFDDDHLHICIFLAGLVMHDISAPMLSHTMLEH